MKVIGVIVIAVILALTINFALMDKDVVSKQHFDERINEIESRIDSVRADVAKVWNVSRETKGNTDSIKTELRSLDAKVEKIGEDIEIIKTTTNNIEFKLF